MTSTRPLNGFYAQLAIVTEYRNLYIEARDEPSYARLTGQRMLACAILDGLRPTLPIDPPRPAQPHPDSYLTLLREVWA